VRSDATEKFSAEVVAAIPDNLGENLQPSPSRLAIKRGLIVSWEDRAAGNRAEPLIGSLFGKTETSTPGWANKVAAEIIGLANSKVKRDDGEKEQDCETGGDVGERTCDVQRIGAVVFGLGSVIVDTRGAATGIGTVVCSVGSVTGDTRGAAVGIGAVVFGFGSVIVNTRGAATGIGTVVFGVSFTVVDKRGAATGIGVVTAVSSVVVDTRGAAVGSGVTASDWTELEPDSRVVHFLLPKQL